MASTGQPIMKCPVISISIPSLSWDTGTRGLELRHASIRHSIEKHSSWVILTLATIQISYSLWQPPRCCKKCGERSGMNFHEILWDVQKLMMSRCDSSWRRKVYNSLISLLASTKLVPWSLHSRDGFPRRDKSPQCRNECFCHKVGDQLKMDSLYGQGNKDTNVSFNKFEFTHIFTLDHDGTCIIQLNSVKCWSWSDMLKG